MNSILVQRVWSKARIVDKSCEGQGLRKDACGAWIRAEDYGNRSSMYGWEIDHIVPKSRGGNDNIGNLRPLHWQNNAAKADGQLVCVVRATV